jgi:hypothetical protein
MEQARSSVAPSTALSGRGVCRLCKYSLPCMAIATTIVNAALQDVGFANILSKTHLSNNNAFTFAWAAPEARALRPWRRLACLGCLLAPHALLCLHRLTEPCPSGVCILWRRTQTARALSWGYGACCKDPGADMPLVAQVLMGTSCTEKADIYSCAPSRCLR